MGRFVRVVPRVLGPAILLMCFPGITRATEWEDGLVLEDAQGVADSSVLIPDTTDLPADSPPLMEPPLESVPAPTPPMPEAMPWEPGAHEVSASFQPAMRCAPETLHQPGLVQALAAHKHALWTFRSEALLLWRNAPSSRPIYSTVIPDTDTLGPTALDASNLNSDVLVAPRLSFLRTDCDGRTFEATYFYAGNFFSERTLPYSPDGYATSPPGIYGNTWGPPDTSLDGGSAKLLGQLQSLEFNTRRCIWPETCQFLMGFRWLQWNETLQMNDRFAYEDPSPVTGQDFYETRCFNNLWGGQIGLDALVLGRAGMARVEGLVKAGAYYNNAGQASSVRYVLSDGYEFANQARAGGPAACSFVGEVGLTAVLPVSCNWDFRCGYFGLWLTNLAQPTRQLSGQTINQFASVGSLDTAGSAILQGLSLGLEGRW